MNKVRETGNSFSPKKYFVKSNLNFFDKVVVLTKFSGNWQIHLITDFTKFSSSGESEFYTAETKVKLTWESIVLKNDLMNNSTAGFPESDTVFSSTSGQKVVNFFVDILGPFEIFDTFDLSLDQVITMNRRRYSNFWQSR